MEEGISAADKPTEFPAPTGFSDAGKGALDEEVPSEIAEVPSEIAAGAGLVAWLSGVLSGSI